MTTLSFKASGQPVVRSAQSEVPQYTLVGNAVPPLMAKGIGEILLGKLS